MLGLSSPAFSSSRFSPYSLIPTFSILFQPWRGGFFWSSDAVQLYLTEVAVGVKGWEKSKRKRIRISPRTFGTTQLAFSRFSSGLRYSPHCPHHANLWLQLLSGTGRLGEKKEGKKDGGNLSTLWLVEACSPGSLTRKAGLLSQFLYPFLLTYFLSEFPCGSKSGDNREEITRKLIFTVSFYKFCMSSPICLPLLNFQFAQLFVFCPEF